MNKNGFFKGWAVPGPEVPGRPDASIGADETLDALSGHYRIYQLKNGHRFSTDDLLAAWYGTSWQAAARQVLDLGSGIGSVAMTAAWRLQGASFVTVEAQEQSVGLARKSAEYNGLTGRFDIRLGDFRDENVLGKRELFDLVLGSPPYFPLGAGITSEHPQKIACRFETRGSIADYCFVAARQLAPGGMFAVVFPCSPDDQQNRLIDAARVAGLSLVRQRKVVFREPEAPLVAVSLLMRSQDLPENFREQTWFEPHLVIRCQDGEVHPEYSAVKLSIGFRPF